MKILVWGMRLRIKIQGNRDRERMLKTFQENNIKQTRTSQSPYKMKEK